MFGRLHIQNFYLLSLVDATKNELKTTICIKSSFIHHTCYKHAIFKYFVAIWCLPLSLICTIFSINCLTIYPLNTNCNLIIRKNFWCGNVNYYFQPTTFNLVNIFDLVENQIFEKFLKFIKRKPIFLFFIPNMSLVSVFD